MLQSWKIATPINVGPFKPQQRHYLDYHRREVFEQPENGRRGPPAQPGAAGLAPQPPS